VQIQWLSSYFLVGYVLDDNYGNISHVIPFVPPPIHCRIVGLEYHRHGELFTAAAGC